MEQKANEHFTQFVKMYSLPDVKPFLEAVLVYIEPYKKNDNWIFSKWQSVYVEFLCIGPLTK